MLPCQGVRTKIKVPLHVLTAPSSGPCPSTELKGGWGRSLRDYLWYMLTKWDEIGDELADVHKPSGPWYRFKAVRQVIGEWQENHPLTLRKTWIVRQSLAQGSTEEDYKLVNLIKGWSNAHTQMENWGQTLQSIDTWNISKSREGKNTEGIP